MIRFDFILLPFILISNKIFVNRVKQVSNSYSLNEH